MDLKAWQRYFETASGLSSITRSSAERIVKTLVKQGEVAADQLERTVDELLRRSEHNRKAITNLIRSETERAVRRISGVRGDDVTARASAAPVAEIGTTTPPAGKKVAKRSAAAKRAAQAARASQSLRSTTATAKTTSERSPADGTGGPVSESPASVTPVLGVDEGSAEAPARGAKPQVRATATKSSAKSTEKSSKASPRKTAAKKSLKASKKTAAKKTTRKAAAKKTTKKAAAKKTTKKTAAKKTTKKTAAKKTTNRSTGGRT